MMFWLKNKSDEKDQRLENIEPNYFLIHQKKGFISPISSSKSETHEIKWHQQPEF